MRKVYSKPTIEVELYTLDQSIAANCGNVVTLGPGDYEDKVCDKFKGDDEILTFNPGFSVQSTAKSFYNGENGPVCDCYYSSGGEGYFTS